MSNRKRLARFIIMLFIERTTMQSFKALEKYSTIYEMKKQVTNLLNIIPLCSKFNCFKQVCVYIHKTHCVGIEKRPEVYVYIKF